MSRIAQQVDETYGFMMGKWPEFTATRREDP
jgi:hypothetical protein